MELRKTAFVNQIERTGKHFFALGWKPGDNVGAKSDVRTQPPNLMAESDRIAARMTALHALENDIVARLQRQVKMRHQPRLACESIQQVDVGLDRVDR